MVELPLITSNGREARHLWHGADLAPSQIHVFIHEIAVGDSKAIAAFHLND
jgi:hypothetical protein